MLDGQTDTAHVQWFEHSSKTFLQEIADPKELFLTNICDNIPVSLFSGRVNATHLQTDTYPQPQTQPRYYYK